MKSELVRRTVQKSHWWLIFAAFCAIFLGGCANASLTTNPTPPNGTPPTAPANLTATAISPVQIRLTWTASTDKTGVTDYLVERCEGAGCSNFAQVGTPTTTSFSDAALTGSTSYSYRVRATDAAGNLSAYSGVATASTMAPTFLAPSNLSAVAAGSTQVNVTWNAATETGGKISKYLVERCAGAGCANFAQVATSVTTAFSDTGLAGATSYSYRVRATDAANDLSAYSNIATVTTAAPTLTAPANLAATATSSTQINLSWSGSTEIGGTISAYLVERCQGAGCTNFVQVGTSATTSYSDTGLTASMTYSYRVRAKDTQGNLSAYSNATNATTPGPNLPTAPGNLTATAASAAQINLAWTASTEAGGTIGQYLVERCAGAGCSNFAQVGASATTSYSDTGLSASTSYSYRVRASDTSNNLGPYSNTATATTGAPTLTAPGNLTATAASAAQINLTWTAATETGGTISRYLVERCAGAGCTNFAQVGTSATTSYNDTGLTGSTSYTYRVRATDASGDLGPYSNTATAATSSPAFTAPGNLTATAASAVQINLAWTAATETGGTISQYLVERCEGTGCANFAQVGTATTTSYSDTGLIGSTSYSYRVRATDASGDLGPYSNTATVTTLSPTFTAPGNLTGTVASAVQINLTWAAATEAGGTISGYQIQRCSGTGCSNFAQVGTSTTTSYSDTALNGSTNYSYRVRATDSLGNTGPFSTVFSATTSAPTLTAPGNLTATAVSAVQINLAWTAATETGGTISQYLVERCAGAGCTNFVQVGTSTTTSYSNTGLNGSTSYSYRVRATDVPGDLGPYSNTATAITAAPTLTAPANLTATATSSAQINLTWTASTETGGIISQYLVQRCQGTGCTNFVQVGTPATTSYSDTGLAASTTYSYQVQATDVGGDLSALSNVATATTPAAGGNISVSITPVQGGITTSQTLLFTATVTNDVGAAGVKWSMTGGTLTGQTLTTATFSSTTAGSFTITATSNAENTQSASATIGVTDLTGMYTYHNDLSRDGVNSQEYALTTANVATGSFGKLFSCTTDGAIYAQPLWVANLPIGGGTHNVVFVATTHDTVFAFDADASPCVQYWSTSLLGSGETWLTSSDVGTGDIQPDIGVIGTPVIDPSTNTIYVVSKSKTSGTSCTPATSCFQRLHALSLINGSEKFGGPTNISAAISVPGTGDGSSGGSVSFNTLTQNQRPGLVLTGGVVYVMWASHGDNPPYHGWVLGFSASTMQLVATFNCNPNGSDTGIWMSGGAPSVDASGNLYFLTGNGTFDANTGGSDYGDSTLKLSTSGGISVAGYFTPADQQSLEDGDTDHGAGGAAILVDQPAGAPVQHLVIGGGKEGNMFLLNRDNLGGYGGNFTPNDSNVVQKFSIGSPIFATAAFFNNGLYIAGINASLKVFAFNTTTGQFNTTSTSQSPSSYGFPGATPSISALGTTNAIAWALNNYSYCTAGAACGPAILRAYDATNLATELWNSSQNSGDAAGNAVKFTVPTVANGKVYVGTRGNDTGNGGTTVPGELDVYGLKPN